MKKVKQYIVFPVFFTFFLASCFAQVSGLDGWNICLDPGHSRTENMGIYGYSEAEKNLRVGLHLMDILLGETDIDTVYITRTNDEDSVTLSQRTDYANSVGAAWFHSIHSDAGSPEYNSTLLLWGELYDGTPDPPVGGEDMSDIMVDILTRGMRTNTRGSWGDCSFYWWSNWCEQSGGPYLWVNRMTDMPSELSEAGFHTNPMQNQLNMNAEWKRLEAKTFYWSILQYHGIGRPFVGTSVGIISDLESTIPINGAVVTLNGQTYTTDTFESLFHNYTDDPDLLHNGFYFFENLPNDTLQMTVEADNYGSDTFQVAIVDTFFTFRDVQLISTIPPYVVSTTPAEGDTNFPAWDPIIIDFSRNMNQTSVETTFVIVPQIGGSFFWSDEETRLTFVSDSMQFETEYTLTISGSAQGQYGHLLDGNGDGIGGDDFTLNFKTGPPDMTPPELISVYPPMVATNIELDPIINLTYDEELDPTSISDSIVILERFYDHSSVSGTLEHYVANEQSVLCFFPLEILYPDEIYITRIYPGLQDLFGNETTSLESYSFETANYTYDITEIDDFESGVTTNWWAPQQSGSTTGIITDSTDRSVNTSIVNILTSSTQSLQVDYGWDINAGYWLIRVYLSGGAPKDVWFDSSYILQTYIFGNGSGNKFRFCVDDNVPISSAENHEVSPWYTIDWIGWKLISWDMTNDSTGTWIGDGNLDGTLRFDSIQLTYSQGSSLFGTFYFDDLQLAEILPVSVAEETGLFPERFVLHQNYPNPFNPVTTILYELPEQAYVKLIVYDVLGRKVKVLVDEVIQPGHKTVIWDATDDTGKHMSTGTYIYRISAGFLRKAGNFTQSHKMILLK